MKFINTVTLKNETNRVIRQVKASRRAVVVTQRGVPAVAIVPIHRRALAWAYDRAFQSAIAEGLADLKAGRSIGLKEFLRRRHA